LVIANWIIPELCNYYTPWKWTGHKLDDEDPILYKETNFSLSCLIQSRPIWHTVPSGTAIHWTVCSSVRRLEYGDNHPYLVPRFKIMQSCHLSPIHYHGVSLGTKWNLLVSLLLTVMTAQHPVALLHFTYDNKLPSQCNCYTISLSLYTTCFGLNRPSSGVFTYQSCYTALNVSHSLHMYFHVS
jgi:hypothetical protein